MWLLLVCVYLSGRNLPLSAFSTPAVRDNGSVTKRPSEGGPVEPEHISLIAIIVVLIPTLAVSRKRQRAGVGWGEAEITPAAQGSPEAAEAAERSCNEGWWASVLLRLFMALGVNLVIAGVVLLVAAVVSFVGSFFGLNLSLGAYTGTVLILLGLFMAAGIGGAVCFKACEGDAIKAGQPLDDVVSSGTGGTGSALQLIHLVIETVERYLRKHGVSVPAPSVFTVTQYLLLAAQAAIIVLDVLRSL